MFTLRSNTCRGDERIRGLLAEAALFNLLAQGFYYPGPEQQAAVKKAFSRVQPHRDPRTRRIPRGRLLKAAQRAWEAAELAVLQAEYGRLFLGNVPCPLHETAYGDGRRIAGRAVELADIQGFYSAFGFALADDNPDLPDHLCTELEFYSLLLVKQAYALHCNWPARHRVARRAAAAFLEQHLGRWIGALGRSLADQRAATPYLALAALLEFSVKEQGKRLRITPQLAESRLPYDAMQADVFNCQQGVESPHLTAAQGTEAANTSS